MGIQMSFGFKESVGCPSRISVGLSTSVEFKSEIWSGYENLRV